MRHHLATACLALGALACGGGRPKAPVIESHAPPPDDPRRLGEEPNDGLEVEGLVGTLDEFDVVAVINEALPGFQVCFERNAGTFVAGKVVLEFDVARDGVVAKVWVAESDLGDWRVESCLAETAGFLRFPRPFGGGPAHVAYPFSWNERGRRLATDVPIDWGYPTLREGDAALRACRDAHGFAGPFHLTTYIGRKGQVLSAGLHTARPAPAFTACISEAVRALTFPDPGARIYRFRAVVEDVPPS